MFARQCGVYLRICAHVYTRLYETYPKCVPFIKKGSCMNKRLSRLLIFVQYCYDSLINKEKHCELFSTNTTINIL